MMSCTKYIQTLQKIKIMGIEALLEYDKIYAYKEYILLEMYDYPHCLANVDTNHLFNESNRIEMLLAICDGNLNLHEKKLVNGNIHPNNILIDEKNFTIKIADYCKNMLYGKNIAMNINNKIAYMSPETITNKEINSNSDVWSIGCLFYYILTNKHVFLGETIEETKKKISDYEYNELNYDFSNLYNPLLKKMLQFIPSNRIALKDLKNELLKINTEIQNQTLLQSVSSSETKEEKKKVVSEYLNKILSKQYPENTSKIIEKLLDIEISELLSLIKTPEIFENKIQEIIYLLNLEQFNNSIEGINDDNNISKDNENNNIPNSSTSHELSSLSNSIKEQLNSLDKYLMEKISLRHPYAARTITDMILSMELPEIILMIDNPPLLDDKIKECLAFIDAMKKEEEKGDYKCNSNGNGSSGSDDIDDDDDFYFRNCYFKYFPNNWHEEDFVELFEKYGGKVTNIKVYDKYGYVCFENNEQARNIIKELGGKQLSFGSRPFAIYKYIPRTNRGSINAQQQQQQPELFLQEQQQQFQNKEPFPTPLSLLIIGNAQTAKSKTRKIRKYISDYVSKRNTCYSSIIVNMILGLNMDEVMKIIDTPRMLDAKIKEIIDELDNKKIKKKGESISEVKVLQSQPLQQQPPPELFQQQQQQQQSLSLSLIKGCKTIDEQKDALAVHLYQIIKKTHPDKAAKITGMLIEMEIPEILLLVETPCLLNNKIQEALNVLNERERKINKDTANKSNNPNTVEKNVNRNIVRGDRIPVEISQQQPQFQRQSQPLPQQVIQQQQQQQQLLLQQYPYYIYPYSTVNIPVRSYYSPPGFIPVPSNQLQRQSQLIVNQPQLQPQQRRQQSLSQTLIAGCRTIDEMKNALGEYLYQIISRTHPDKAPKITGILLEMKMPEILLMIDAPEILENKIKEAFNELEEKKIKNKNDNIKEHQNQSNSPPQLTLSQSLIAPYKTIEEQKSVLKNYLYQHISNFHPDNNHKILEKLLEMDVPEIMLMIDTPGMLEKRIEEVVNGFSNKSTIKKMDFVDLSDPPSSSSHISPQSPQSLPDQQRKENSKSPVNDDSSEEQQKKELIDKVYNSVFEYCKEKAPQVTGMILEMKISEILDTIGNPSKLKRKIQESLAKLSKK